MKQKIWQIRPRTVEQLESRQDNIRQEWDNTSLPKVQKPVSWVQTFMEHLYRKRGCYACPHFFDSSCCHQSQLINFIKLAFFLRLIVNKIWVYKRFSLHFTQHPNFNWWSIIIYHCAELLYSIKDRCSNILLYSGTSLPTSYLIFQ